MSEAFNKWWADLKRTEKSGETVRWIFDAGYHIASAKWSRIHDRKIIEHNLRFAAQLRSLGYPNEAAELLKESEENDKG